MPTTTHSHVITPSSWNAHAPTYLVKDDAVLPQGNIRAVNELIPLNSKRVWQASEPRSLRYRELVAPQPEVVAERKQVIRLRHHALRVFCRFWLQPSLICRCRRFLRRWGLLLLLLLPRDECSVGPRRFTDTAGGAAREGSAESLFYVCTCLSCCPRPLPRRPRLEKNYELTRYRLKLFRDSKQTTTSRSLTQTDVCLRQAAGCRAGQKSSMEATSYVPYVKSPRSLYNSKAKKEYEYNLQHYRVCFWN